MAIAAFDTLEFVESLEASGFTKQQSKGMVVAFKGDIVDLKGDLRELGSRLDRRIDGVMGELTLVKWMLGLLVGGVTAIIFKTFFA
ncbi:MAG: DUF1640 domain-containing protein [Magnetococcales bacterium]|nr:DUF1640 domain-containing protein [Magnetococcales bacterium]